MFTHFVVFLGLRLKGIFLGGSQPSQLNTGILKCRSCRFKMSQVTLSTQSHPLPLSNFAGAQMSLLYEPDCTKAKPYGRHNIKRKSKID
jgi:hypothetical protein